MDLFRRTAQRNAIAAVANLHAIQPDRQRCLRICQGAMHNCVDAQLFDEADRELDLGFTCCVLVQILSLTGYR